MIKQKNLLSVKIKFSESIVPLKNKRCNTLTNWLFLNIILQLINGKYDSYI